MQTVTTLAPRAYLVGRGSSLAQVTGDDFDRPYPIICMNHATLHVQGLGLDHSRIVHAQCDPFTIDIAPDIEMWLSRQAADHYQVKEAFRPFTQMGGNTIVRILHAMPKTVFKIVACDVLTDPKLRDYDSRYPAGDIGKLLDWVEPYRDRLVTEWP